MNLTQSISSISCIPNDQVRDNIRDKRITRQHCAGNVVHSTFYVFSVIAYLLLISYCLVIAYCLVSSQFVVVLILN